MKIRSLSVALCLAALSAPISCFCLEIGSRYSDPNGESLLSSFLQGGQEDSLSMRGNSEGNGGGVAASRGRETSSSSKQNDNAARLAKRPTKQNNSSCAPLLSSVTAQGLARQAAQPQQQGSSSARPAPSATGSILLSESSRPSSIASQAASAAKRGGFSLEPAQNRAPRPLNSPGAATETSSLPPAAALQEAPLLYAAASNYSNGSAVASTQGSGSFFVNGVDGSKISNSDRFYDNGKGYYFGAPSLSTAALNLKFQTGNYHFFGELEERIDSSKYNIPQITAPLQNDSKTCWYNASSNLIQYWESYYGIFYQGKSNGEALPYGYTYDSKYLSQLGGSLSLRVDLKFYDSWDNVGGNNDMALRWYFAGKGHSSAHAEAGYFQDFYGSEDPSVTLNFNNGSGSNCRGNDIASFQSELYKSLGLSEENGQLIQKQVGLISYIGLKHTDADGTRHGHALTCYGFSLNSEGVLDSLYVANSDDSVYQMLQLYLGMQDGQMTLYTDAARSEQFLFSERTAWSIESLGYINSTQELQDMYADYVSHDLEWTGLRSNKTWSAAMENENNTAALPDEQSGWDVAAGSGSHAGYYHSYYSAERNLRFSDYAADGEVKIQGSVSAAAIHIDNSETDYAFSGSSNASVSMSELRKSSAGTADFNAVALHADSLVLEGGSLSLSNGSSLQAAAGSIGAGCCLALNNAQAAFDGELSLGSGALIAASGSGNSLSFGSLTLDESAGFRLTLSDSNISDNLLSLSGNIHWTGQIRLDILGDNLNKSETYRLINFGDSPISLEAFSSSKGYLSMEGSTLVLSLISPNSRSWDSGSGTWNQSSWNNSSGSAEGCDVVFIGKGSEEVAIQISGAQNTGSMEITGGSYSFSGNGSVTGDKELRISGQAQVSSSVDLGQRAIALEKGSSLHYNSVNSKINSLAMEEGSSLALTDGNYSIFGTGELQGEISGTGSSLAFRCAEDAQIHSISSLDTDGSEDFGSSVSFSNSSSSKDIEYSLDKLKVFMVNIGQSGDSKGTTLHVNVGDLSGMVKMEDNSCLKLSGSGSFLAYLSGSGRLEVAEDGDVQLMSSLSCALDVRGKASWGNAQSALSTSLSKDLRISGELQATINASSTINISQLSLEGGTMQSLFLSKSLSQNDGQQNICSLCVGENGGSLLLSSDSSSQNGRSLRSEIQSLSGNGELCLQGDNAAMSSIFRIKDSSSFHGAIELSAGGSESRSGLISCSVLELAGNRLEKALRLSVAEGMEASRAVVLQLSADSSVGGLDSESEAAYLFGGSFSGTSANSVEERQQTAAENQQLEIKSNSDHSFAGKLGAGLDLRKSGSGTQSFAGDNSGFAGKIDLQEGGLSFHGDLKLSELSLREGSRLESDGYIAVNGALAFLKAETIMENIAEASALSLADIAQPSASANGDLQSDLDLRQCSSLILEHQVDLGGHSLLLSSQNPIQLSYDLDLLSSSNGLYKLTLFSSVGSLNVDEESQSNWNAAATEFFTGFGITEESRIVYDGGNIMLEGLLIPEPATSTLSLLALAALVSRRRRK